MPACRGLEDSNGYNEGHDAQRAMADLSSVPNVSSHFLRGDCSADIR